MGIWKKRISIRVPSRGFLDVSLSFRAGAEGVMLRLSQSRLMERSPASRRRPTVTTDPAQKNVPQPQRGEQLS